MKKILAMLLAALLLAAVGQVPAAGAEETMRGAYIRDGEHYTYFLKDASGNAVFTAELDPIRVGDQTYYAFNPLSYGIRLDVTVSSGYESFGSGKACTVLTLPMALQRCCGFVCYAQLKTSAALQCQTALMCSTQAGQDALVVCSTDAKTNAEGMLVINAVRGDLYSMDTPITALREVVLAPDPSSGAAPGVTELVLDALSLYFCSGEDACVCLDQLAVAYGLDAQAEPEDYYYTTDGVEYRYIPSVVGTEEISFVPNEFGYYEVATFDYENSFFSAGMTPQFGGQREFMYLSFASPVVDCIGIVSYVYLEPINYNYFADLRWGISVKDAASQEWYAFDYFDYAGCAGYGDFKITGVLFPWAMAADGLMICPLELPELDFEISYTGGCAFFFLDGPSAMRFMHTFEQSCTPAAAVEDVTEMKSIFYAVKDSENTIVSSALLVDVPGAGQFAFTSPFYVDELADEYATVNPESGCSYTIRFYGGLGDVNVWTASPDDAAQADAMCLRAGAAPKEGDVVYVVYPSRQDGAFLLLRAENSIGGVESFFQDGAAILRLRVPVDEVYTYPGVVIDANGDCLGILIGEDEVYLNWYS